MSPVRENILLVGVHFRVFVAPVTILLHGAKSWLLAQQGVPAHPQVPLMAQTHTGLAAQSKAEGDEALGEPQGAARPGGSHGGQTFGDDAAMAVAITAKPLADVQLATYLVCRPGQVGQGPFIMAVEALRWDRADMGPWSGSSGPVG